MYFGALAQVLFDDDEDGGKANRYTLSQLQELVLSKLSAGSLRCQYKSRNEFVLNGFFGRPAARSRATAESCDNWDFGAGEEISLLVWNYPYTGSQKGAVLGGGQIIEQHARWFPVMELHMPHWWQPEAAGSGLPLRNTQSQKSVPQPAVAEKKIKIVRAAIQSSHPERPSGADHPEQPSRADYPEQTIRSNQSIHEHAPPHTSIHASIHPIPLSLAVIHPIPLTACPSLFSNANSPTRQPARPP